MKGTEELLESTYDLLRKMSCMCHTNVDIKHIQGY